jgi:hypothetical protein
MALLERNLGRVVARPPSKEKGSGWFGRNKKASAGESEGLPPPQQEMRRMRSDRTHQRLVKAKEKGSKESTKWAAEAEAHRAKAAAEAKVQAAREEALNKDREQSLARILSEERKTESAQFNYLRAEAVKRWGKSPRHADACRLSLVLQSWEVYEVVGQHSPCHPTSRSSRGQRVSPGVPSACLLARDSTRVGPRLKDSRELAWVPKRRDAMISLAGLGSHGASSAPATSLQCSDSVARR